MLIYYGMDLRNKSIGSRNISMRFDNCGNCGSLIFEGYVSKLGTQENSQIESVKTGKKP